MKKIVLISLFFACFAGYGLSQETPFIRNNQPLIAEKICQESTDTTSIEKRGCCSWHGGVCGCKNERVICCDGTISPSCRC